MADGKKRRTLLGSKDKGATPTDPPSVPPPVVDVYNLSIRDSQPELQALAESTTPAPAYSNYGVGRHDAEDDLWDGPRRKKKQPAKDFFSYSDEDPPTEEGNEPIYEDRAPLYVAPMNVPEQTPIPGLFERSASDAAALPRSALVRSQTSPHEEEEAEPAPGSRWPLVVIVFIASSIGGVLALIVVGIMALWPETTEEPIPEPVPVSAPPPAPKPPTPPPAADPVVPPPAAVVPTPAPAPTESSTELPKKVVKKQSSAKTKISVRSNRRAMVWIDGGSPDFTPVDLVVSPGRHSIEAAEPGKASTKQTIVVDVGEGKTETVQITF